MEMPRLSKFVYPSSASRDISAGNIMIMDKGDGLLIDWDLSVVVDDSEQSRQTRKQQTVCTFYPLVCFSLIDFKPCFSKGDVAIHIMRTTGRSQQIAHTDR
jgi:hypothetical protein